MGAPLGLAGAGSLPGALYRAVDLDARTVPCNGWSLLDPALCGKRGDPPRGGLVRPLGQELLIMGQLVDFGGS